MDLQEGIYINSASLLGELYAPLVLSALIAVLGLSTSYVLYVVIVAFSDKVRGEIFLPKYPDESPLSASGSRRMFYFLGPRRTINERAVVIDRCASYLFQQSIFRKHWYAAVMSRCHYLTCSA